MSWNSFGNFMSARSSALAEFGNMVANLVSAKNEKDISKRNEYYKQAGYSALLAFGNLASNIAPGSTSSHIVNGTNASVIASRLSGNISSAIQEHKDGKVNINRFQNILADLYSLGGLGSTLIEKNGNMKYAELGDSISNCWRYNCSNGYCHRRYWYDIYRGIL